MGEAKDVPDEMGRTAGLLIKYFAFYNGRG